MAEDPVYLNWAVAYTVLWDLPVGCGTESTTVVKVVPSVLSVYQIMKAFFSASLLDAEKKLVIPAHWVAVI
ncbi:hypothetical protein Ancab_025740 [Ancistrocladus abbreviatus]